MSACMPRGGAGDRPDVGEHAARVSRWEGSYERGRAVELNAAGREEEKPEQSLSAICLGRL
jgi:hypothetical protein